MVDNQHKQITGYRDLDQESIDLMNRVKAAEAAFADVAKAVSEHPGIDKRWWVTSRTHIEEGASALVRSIAKPDSPFD